MLINGFVIDASRRGTRLSAGAADKSDGKVAGAAPEALSMSVTRAVFISIPFPFVMPDLIERVLREQLCKPEYKAIFGIRLL
ncbi:hypothetical protein [Paraburkholderia dipogonis]|jgi:hypothetical protein|uniref:hypothetical protein n=1 Tax=Paraburkholderia dipogonis TaxID=1211383 RepID=UPI0038B77B5C